MGADQAGQSLGAPTPWIDQKYPRRIPEFATTNICSPYAAEFAGTSAAVRLGRERDPGNQPFASRNAKRR